MVFDAEIFERYISKREKAGQSVSGFVRLGHRLFKNSLFLGFMRLLEAVIGFLLTLPIPVYASFIQGMITHLPGSPFFFGIWLRGIYYGRKLKHLGKNVVIEEGVKIVSPQNITIHDNVCIDKGVMLTAGKAKYYKQRVITGKFLENEGELVIGKNVLIASYTTIGATGGMTIGDFTGIGPHCSIFSYVHVSMSPYVAFKTSMRIGQHVAIGTNSSVICVADIADRTYLKPNTFLTDSIVGTPDSKRGKKDTS